MKILLISILFFISQNLFSQNKKIDSTYKIPFDTNKIKDAVRISNTSEVFSYDSLYIWNDKRTLSEIVDERQGYFVNTMGLGERNSINFNGFSEENIGIFRDGIQINDIFYGGFDIQNISINEISKIEEASNVMSFVYGLNSPGKAINIITKDFFNPKPFSQFRYSQDRFNSLFADIIFNLPFSRKLDWMVGGTKHSIDGRYQNSEFDVWRGRTRLSFFPSPKLNLKLNFYYDNIKRGLNEGLVYSPNENTLENSDAAVVDPNSNEQLINFYYDAAFTGRFFKDKNSLTKLKLYSSNSLRYYNYLDTLYYSPAEAKQNYSHSVQYTASLEQNVKLYSNKYFQSYILAGLNFYFNQFNYLYNFGSAYPISQRNNFSSFFSKLDINYKSLFISGGLRIDNVRNNYYSSLGAEASFKIIDIKKIKLKIFSGINNTPYSYYNQDVFSLFRNAGLNFYSVQQYLEVGGVFNYGNLELSVNQYDSYYTGHKISLSNGNYSLNFNSKYVDVGLALNKSDVYYFPDYYLKSNIYYHNLLFRNKLNLKTGFDFKYYNNLKPASYDQQYYRLGPYYYNEELQNKFYVDFYLGARIGHANINLTIANIFNTLYYDTQVYPYDNLGGFLNSISRFTIVWDFIN